MTYNIHVLNPPHRDFYIPLKCVVGYLIGVLLLYQFGPIAWVTHRPLLFYTLQSLYIAFFAFGYYHGIRFYWKPSQRWTEQRTESLLRCLLHRSDFYELFFEELHDEQNQLFLNHQTHRAWPL